MTSLTIALGLFGGVAAMLANGIPSGDGANSAADGAANAEASKSDGPVVTHKAVITTSLGDIEIDLYGHDAPRTVANFVGLAQKDFYNDILFHRIAPGFVIQAGDPKTKKPELRGQWGTGGESIYGKEFEDELDTGAASYKRGYVEGCLAMANHGRNTNSSQFFIVLTTEGAQHLTHNYTIFGMVRAGMDVVHKIENVELDGSTPVTPVKILHVKVTKLEK